MNLIIKTIERLVIKQNMFLLFMSLLVATSHAQIPVSIGNIVYPYRAVPVIVQSGKDFHILFNNKSSNKIDSVTLKAEYWNVKLTLDSVQNGSFEYDTFTKQYTNNKI